MSVGQVREAVREADRKTADDVILVIAVRIVFSHTVGGLLPFHGVSIGVLLFTFITNT